MSANPGPESSDSRLRKALATKQPEVGEDPAKAADAGSHGEAMSKRLVDVKHERLNQDMEKAKIKDNKHKAVQAVVDMTMKVLIASLASNAAFQIVIYIVNGDHDVTIAGSTSEVLYRLPYALLMSLCVPTCQYYLESARNGETLLRDTIKVVHLSLGMSLAWAWKDLVNSMGGFEIIGSRVLVYVVVAVGLQMVTALYESGPCYRHAKSKIKSGKDGIMLRLLTASDQCRLALGFAWNSVVRTPISSVESHPDSNVPTLVQLLYFVIVHATISTVRFRYRLSETKSAAAADTVAGSKKFLLSAWKANVTTFMDALSFVFAWAYFDSLNDIVFGVYGGCWGNPANCSWKLNLAYACVLSVLAILAPISSWDNAILRRNIKWGFSLKESWVAVEEQSTLWATATALAVGWAWTNFWTAYINGAGVVMTQKLNFDASSAVVLMSVALVIVTVPMAGMWYHHYLEEHRSVDDLLQERQSKQTSSDEAALSL